VNRRLFYVALGASVGVLVVRRASQAARRFSPAGVQSGIAGSLGGLGDTLRELAAEIRVAMAEREDELRTTLGLDGSHDVVDAPVQAHPGRTGGMAPDVPEGGVR